MENERAGGVSSLINELPRKVDIELQAIRVIYDKLDSLIPESRHRVFNYIEALFEEPPGLR